MLRGVETICAITEFAPQDEPFVNTVMLYQVLMADHEEEILRHLKTLDYTNADIAKAYTLLPYHQAIRKLDNTNKIVKPVYVSEMFGDAIVELATQTTAEMKTAQLVDATAWASKQMRRNFKKIQDYTHQNMPTPDWVTEIRNKRAKEASDLDEQAKAAAWKRMGGAAPGEPGGLANAKPKVPGNAPKWNPKNRGLAQPPRGHLDDLANFDDGKDNRTRSVSTFARFTSTGDGRSKTQLHKWCICDQSKDAGNKESPTYPGHWAST